MQWRDTDIRTRTFRQRARRTVHFVDSVTPCAPVHRHRGLGHAYRPFLSGMRRIRVI